MNDIQELLDSLDNLANKQKEFSDKFKEKSEPKEGNYTSKKCVIKYVPAGTDILKDDGTVLYTQDKNKVVYELDGFKFGETHSEKNTKMVAQRLMNYAFNISEDKELVGKAIKECTKGDVIDIKKFTDKCNAIIGSHKGDYHYMVVKEDMPLANKDSGELQQYIMYKLHGKFGLTKTKIKYNPEKHDKLKNGHLPPFTKSEESTEKVEVTKQPTAVVEDKLPF